jgi:restriction endonuclease S subunit
MKHTLNDICEIRFGFYSQPVEGGNVPYVQVRQFDDQGVLMSEANDFVVRDQKSEPHLLQDGDVLFVGKGNRLFAWCYRDTLGPYIASSIFFVLRPKKKIIYPEYLAAILNAPQTKATLLQIGSGTNIFSLRKSELGAFQVPILPMEEQKKVALLSELHQKQIALSQELIVQNQNLYSAIISKLIK